MRPFLPLFKNPHLATLAGNFWKRPVSEIRWPRQAVHYRTEPDVEVLVHSQRPDGDPHGELVIVHGLEGSSDSGYARSLSYAALTRGFATHRFNLRSCGDSEELAISGYHAGQTSDLLAVLRQRRAAGAPPLFVVGFSLGGNVAMKLAGELGDRGPDLLAGVCAISVPIDLAICAKALERPGNRLYQDRFVDRLKARIRRRHIQAPHIYSLEDLPKVRTIIDFDNHYTARLFGFGTAANYFATQSSNQFLDRIRVPTLVIQSKDDPMVPFKMFEHPAFARNPFLKLVAVDHGGHVGFVARGESRFWVDATVLDWIEHASERC